MSVNIPGLGDTTRGEQFDWLFSTEREVAVLFGTRCRIVVEDYEEDERKEDFHVAIRNFLAAGESVLRDCEPHIFAYYRDINAHWAPDDDGYLHIATPSDVWAHVALGNEPMVSRRWHGDGGIYISLECNCDWEPEHGLQIVFKNGEKVNKVGAYDGHVTNSDAYGDPKLENVVYR